MTVTINGKKITADEGQTILEAAVQNGIYIPTLCYHKELSRMSLCRICAVEVEKSERLQPACVTMVRENMVIKTDSSRVVQARQTNLKLILANHADNCLVCDAANLCELRKASARYTYKNTAQYVHQRIDKPGYTQSGLMASILPLYSELSSFVHGGPSSLNFCREIENPAIIRSYIVESLSITQMMAFHVQAMTFLMYYQQDKEFCEPYHVMTKYLAKISEKDES